MRLATLCTLLSLTAFLAACDRKAPAIQTDFPLTQLTERVYVIHGPNEIPNKTNQGFMNNPGFVLVRKGVVVIDPGSSVQVGDMLLKKIASVTKDPVIAVFNTHIHGDHWLGNDAIHRAYPKAVIYAHPKMMEKTKGEGANWIRLMNQLTDDGIKGTKAVAPGFGVENNETLALGGLHFRIYHTGVAHTDGDIMIEVVEEGVIFLGDNVLNKRIAANFPERGNIQGQIAAIDLALKSKATHFIPGHGTSGGREIALTQQTLLKLLRASVKKYYDQGLSDFEMKDKVMRDLDTYKDYYDFDNLGRVINAAYLQIETESF